MPSSLIVAALAVAWLVVLVPMIAQRRQEVVRTADTALAARVVHRGGVRRETAEARPMTEHDHRDDHDRQDDHTLDVEVEQPRSWYVSNEDDTDNGDGYDGYDGYDVGYETDGESDVGLEQHDDEWVVHETRRYRPGRGGFDPEAAELAARAKYAFRQRMVLGLLLVAVVSAVLALTITTMLWWLHAAVDLSVIGYLTYLRRQVRIENEVRRRRAARLAAPVQRASSGRVDLDASVADGAEGYLPDEYSDGINTDGYEAIGYDGDWYEREGAGDVERYEAVRRPAPPVRHPTAVRVDPDDEDPAFDDLEGELPAYRRAVGE